jgi:sRNA-binding protein
MSIETGNGRTEALFGDAVTNDESPAKGVKMARKWTDEQKARFKATMKKLSAAKRARAEATMAQREKTKRSKAKGRIKIKTIYYKSNGGEKRKTDVAPLNLPVVEIPNGNQRDMQEFAAFMAEAYRVYKGL